MTMQKPTDLLFFEKCVHFFYKEVKPKHPYISFNIFYDDTGAPTTDEAKRSPKLYPPDGRFWKLLHYRFIDYLRGEKTASIYEDNRLTVEVKTQHFEVDNLYETKPKENLRFNKAIALIDTAANEEYINKFTDGEIGLILAKIAKENNITHFFNKSIDDIEQIAKSKSSSRQLKLYYRKSYKKKLADFKLIRPTCITSIHFVKEDDFKGMDEAAIKLSELGDRSITRAKKIENSKPGLNNIKSLFRCFLLYFKGSVCFKEALRYNAESAFAKYNYAYTQKRLGFIDEAILNLKDLTKKELPTDKLSMVFECLGDAYFMKKEYTYARTNFEKALELTPGDVEVIFNQIDALENENKNNKPKIDDLLTLLLKLKKPTPNFRLNLLEKIADMYGGKISAKAALIKKLK